MIATARILNSSITCQFQQTPNRSSYHQNGPIGLQFFPSHLSMSSVGLAITQRRSTRLWALRAASVSCFSVLWSYSPADAAAISINIHRRRPGCSKPGICTSLLFNYRLVWLSIAIDRRDRQPDGRTDKYHYMDSQRQKRAASKFTRDYWAVRSYQVINSTAGDVHVHHWSTSSALCRHWICPTHLGLHAVLRHACSCNIELSFQ